MKNLLVFAVSVLAIPVLAQETKVAASQMASNRFVIPVLVIHYFPASGTNLDLRVTGDVGGSLEAIREKTRRQTREAIAALEEGSRYRAFLDPSATPALKYQVVGSREFLEPLPTWNKPHHKTPMTDYRQILNRVNIQDWVQQQGVKEVWIWG